MMQVRLFHGDIVDIPESAFIDGVAIVQDSQGRITRVRKTYETSLAWPGEYNEKDVFEVKGGGKN